MAEQPPSFTTVDEFVDNDYGLPSTAPTFTAVDEPFRLNNTAQRTPAQRPPAQRPPATTLTSVHSLVDGTYDPPPPAYEDVVRAQVSASFNNLSIKNL